MGRRRRPIKMVQDVGGRAWCAYFYHPLQNRTVRLALDRDSGLAQAKLDWLNSIFLGPADGWENPRGVPAEIRDLWLCGRGEIAVPKNRSASAVALKALGDAGLYRDLYEKQLAENKRLCKELEHWRGRKLRSGPCPTLQKALETWIENYRGRDADWTKIVGNDLKRFVAHFDPAVDGREAGARVEVDYFSGREREIDTFLRGLVTSKKRGLSAGRRDQFRKNICRFLIDSGVAIDRSALPCASRKSVRSDRGAIRWLEKKEAEAVAAALAAPWNDYFRVQVALGFRPDELITLKRGDFHGAHFETVTLSELDHLTLKQGSRTVRVPADIRALIETRAAANAIIFPEPETGAPWRDPKRFNLRYNAALTAAGKTAGVGFRMDCRVGRRTCASLLIRAGVSIEAVAAMLGDNPATIREHYAAIMPHEVIIPDAAVLRAAVT